ncbi:MAG: nucleotidyltransferase domain-containing protein [Saprospiraceae bacterium]|nr:nucleotidyltransferase domain-containing protein [Saprospiraceae bacterium]
MVTKTIEGIPLIVKETIEKVDAEARVILFGSRARGDFRSDSDWDFLILTKKKASRQLQDKIWELLYLIELNTEQVITSVIENEEVWLKYRESEFFKNVNRDGIEVVSPKAA